VSKIFITHAEANKDVAQALVRLLQTGTRFSQRDVFCSSDEGQGIQTGMDLRTVIRTSLNDTLLAIPLITDEYWLSDWCQWELGAIWLKQCEVFPLFVQPFLPTDVKGPLQGIRGEFVDDTAGLDRLYDAVNRIFALEPITDRWYRERDMFIADLPNLLARYQPSNRMNQKRTAERKQRFADAMHDYHSAFHSLRDAAFVTLLHGVSEEHLEEFVGHLQKAIDGFSDAFTTILGKASRVCVKQTRPFDREKTGPPIVFDLVRSHADIEYGRENYDLIQENTDFEDLLERKVNVFYSNNLIDLYEAGSYKNSHWKDGIPDPPPYVSTIVWPIRKLRYGVSKIEPLLGFLCVDCAIPDAFPAIPDTLSAGRFDHDVGFGAAFADTMYHVLQPWIGEEGPLRRESDQDVDDAQQ